MGSRISKIGNELLISTPKKLQISQWLFTFIVLIYFLTQPFPGMVYFYIAVGMYFIQACMGITAIYHRFLTLESWIPCKFLESFGATMACFGLTSSPMNWVAVHIAPHKYSDTKYDPYSPK